MTRSLEDGPTPPALSPPSVPDHPGLTVRFVDGELELTGRLVAASNATFLTEAGTAGGSSVQAVYKPVAGERPLWDFPGRVLARREVAAHVVSALAGFWVVPYTTWVESGPLGPGSLQAWIDEDPGDVVVELAPSEEVRRDEGSGLVHYEGRDWHDVLDGLDAYDRDVTLLHAEDPRLRAMALFDAVINNADRKGGHIITSGGRLFGVDHGISFHPDPKLRTLLWGWAGVPFSDAELAQVRQVAALCDRLEPLLGAEDTEALMRRCARLLQRGRFPRSDPARHTIPWPPW